MKNYILISTFMLITTLYSQCESNMDQNSCLNGGCFWNVDCGYCNEAIQGQNECPIDIFLNPDDWPGPGGSYPDPQINITCDNQYVYLSSNGMPNYQYIQMTPNALNPQNWTIQWPRYPIYSETPTYLTTNQNNNDCPTTPLLGRIGVVINGIVFFGPTEGPFPDPYGDPNYVGIVDYCGGHTGPQGEYHGHALYQDCLVLNSNDFDPSPILGYALDGFPVYGPYGCLDLECNEIVEMQSSYQQISNPTECAMDSYEFVAVDSPEFLDECNGRFGPDGTYRYHTTQSYPYIIGCYHGTVEISPGGGPSGGVEGIGSEGTLVEDIFYGDLNEDQLVNVVDIITLVNTILSSGFDPDGDMNQDCIANILDVISIVNLILD